MDLAIDQNSIPKQENDSNYQLSLDSVKWNRNYSLSRASIGQIMRSFNNILSVNPKNIYEETLYKHLKPEVQKLMDDYNQLLLCDNAYNFNVRYYNLIVNMPKDVSIYNQEHGNIRLGNPKIGALIKASKQRIDFIINREIPYICKQDQNIHIEFIKLQQDMIKFKETLINFEKQFVLAIDKAHKSQQVYYKS